MRPPFNYFQPQARPQQQQQNNGYHQHNQLGMMMNPQNPMMGQMIPVPNMPIQHPHFFFNNMHQQQHQFGLPNHHINQFLPNLSLNFYRPPPLGPCAFSSLNSFNPQLRPQPRPQGGNFNNVNGSNTKHQKFNGSGQGFQRSQLHGPNKKSGFNKEHKGKRNYNKMSTSHDGSGVDSIPKEKKRPYVCFYTPKEIQLWRQARRRNFPTKHNILKKSKKNLKEEAKLRRQQLQEVVAKQAELGVEVAQVPSHYLSGTQEQQANGNTGDNNGQALNDQYKDGRRGRSQNNKTRHGEKEKPRSEDQNSSQEEPTLLEKLLSADTKRDKSRLLQVLRFMVMNSFFKDQLPLKLPLVMVEEHVREDEDEDEVDVDMNGNDNSAVER